jgi:hypothetical protein
MRAPALPARPRPSIPYRADARLVHEMLRVAG